MTKPFKVRRTDQPAVSYRLALRLGGADHLSPAGKASLAWALVRLSPVLTRSGWRALEDEAAISGKPEELRVIVYADPAQSLSPMTPEQFERQLQRALDMWPGKRPRVVRVPFDQAAYAAWLKGAPDSQEKRAEWANQLEIDECTNGS